MWGVYVFLHNRWISYKAKANAAFDGNWSNGGVYKSNPTHYVDVEIFGSDDEIRGSVNIRKWNEENSWHNASLMGERTFKRVTCKIIEVVNDKKEILGTVLFRRNKKKLRWTLK